jgi:hypothetical protein
MANCKNFNVLGDHQDGFRKGRSTIRTLDRIILSIILMLNIKNGCTLEAVKMHADTLLNAKYFLKTKNRISETSYSHSAFTPVYGNGQGAGDLPCARGSTEVQKKKTILKLLTLLLVDCRGASKIDCEFFPQFYLGHGGLSIF